MFRIASADVSQRAQVRAAFTLIELLVVVTIIAMLIALLLPSMRQAVQTSRLVACSANQRQIGFAHASYTLDHHGAHPPSSTDSDDPHWLDLMGQYHGEVDAVRYCPSVEGYRTPVADDGSSPNQIGDRDHHWWLRRNTHNVSANKGGSYGVNIYTHATAGWGTNLDWHFRKDTAARRPAATPLLGDAIWHNAQPHSTNTPPVMEPTNFATSGGGVGRYCIRRHFQGINVSFLDLHVEHLPLEHLWRLQWNRMFTPTQNMILPY